MTRTLAAAAFALALMSPSIDAEACSCIAPDTVNSWRTSDHAFIGKVLGETVYGNWRVFDVLVLQTTKSCLVEQSVVRVATQTSSAACGTFLRTGANYMIYGDDQTVRGNRVIVTNDCKGNKLVRDLTPDDRQFLRHRPLDCPSPSLCADGAPMFNCLIHPCSQSTCSSSTTNPAHCEDNYCSGCTAEWYTADDYATCQPW